MSVADDIQTLVSRAIAGHNATSFVVGVVSSTSPFEVTLWGDAVAVPASLRLSGYTPAAADKVLLAYVPPQLIALGKLVSA